jgi:hypothetical protein
MKIRPILPRPGRCGWTCADTLNPLPPGLPDRLPVFILAVNDSGLRAQDASGHQWELGPTQVDCGLYCCTPAGGWVHESSPVARTILRRQLHQHLAGPRPEGSAAARWEEKVIRIQWILLRNGEDVDALAPVRK